MAKVAADGNLNSQLQSDVTSAVNTCEPDTVNAGKATEGAPEKIKKAKIQGGSAVTKRYVYAGPSLTGSGLQKNRVYKGGIPEEAIELAGDMPQIMKMFVEVNENLPEKLQKFNKPGTVESKHYNDVLAFFISKKAGVVNE